MVELTAYYNRVREDVARLISMTFFRYFTVIKENKALPPCSRLLFKVGDWRAARQNLRVPITFFLWISYSCDEEKQDGGNGRVETGGDCSCTSE